MFRAHLCLSEEGGYNHLVLDGHLQQNTTCIIMHAAASDHTPPIGIDEQVLLLHSALEQEAII